MDLSAARLITDKMHVLDQNGWHCRFCGQVLTTEPRAHGDSSIILSVLIPVHNEGDQIAENLSLIHAEASKTGLPMEMIAVDDGSTDKTWPVLQRMVEHIPGLKAVRFSRNFGKEAAICAGFAYSSGQACIVIDSDLQHPPRVNPRNGPAVEGRALGCRRRYKENARDGAGDQSNRCALFLSDVEPSFRIQPVWVLRLQAFGQKSD